MLHAIKELERALKYHTKQLEENKREIQRKEEAILLLHQSNEVEEETIQVITQAIEQLKKD
jgi:hypothetical protein